MCKYMVNIVIRDKAGERRIDRFITAESSDAAKQKAVLRETQNHPDALEIRATNVTRAWGW